jgi:hypothetical protein
MHTVCALCACGGISVRMFRYYNCTSGVQAKKNKTLLLLLAPICHVATDGEGEGHEGWRHARQSTCHHAAAGSARNLIHSVWVWLLVLLLSHPRPHIDKAS